MAKVRRRRIGLSKPKQRLMMNIGGLLDIPTGYTVTGAKGEKITMGGLADIYATSGAGNSYKSVFSYFVAMSAANHIAATHEPYISIYDTENNINENRINNLASRFEYLTNNATDADEGFIETSDKSILHGDVWWNETKNYSKEVQKDPEAKVKFTAFVDKNKKPLVDIIPSIILVDSFSKFESKASLDLLDRAKKDDSSTSTYYLQSGGFKSKMLTELTMISPRANLFFITTAHIGTKFGINENKYSKPAKTLGYLKEGEELKKVTKEFTYLTKVLWKVLGVSPLKSDDGKTPLYPMKGAVNTKTDLNIIRIEALRNKSGASGVVLEIVVSQSEGVLPTLSEFHFIKTNGYYGLGGNPRNFHSVFLPKISLSRTTVREKIDRNKKLRRAIKITADLLQYEIYRPEIRKMNLLMTPEELYKKMMELGYDWNDLLETRDWWAIDQYNEKIPHFLSTLDLLEIANGIKTPYWMKNDKKSK